MDKANLSKIKLALLGHGDFATPSFEILKKHFKIVKQNEADCLIVANYGKILTAIELKKPKFGAINLHGSLLPKYRGASPVQTSIANGDKITGVSIIKMDTLVDHGAILAAKQINIDQDDTTPELLKKLGSIAANLILKVVVDYLTGKLNLIVQNASLATYCQKIDRSIILDYKDNQQKIYNYYRAYSKEPGLFIKLEDGSLLKIINAKITDKFVPILVQKPGKKIVSYLNFLNGYRNKPPF